MISMFCFLNNIYIIPMLRWFPNPNMDAVNLLCPSQYVLLRVDVIVLEMLFYFHFNGFNASTGLGVLYFEFSIIKSSSCSAQVHSYCAPHVSFSNVKHWQMQFSHFFLKYSQTFLKIQRISSHFSTFLKYSHFFKIFFKNLEISQDFPTCFKNLKIPQISSKRIILSY